MKRNNKDEEQEFLRSKEIVRGGLEDFEEHQGLLEALQLAQPRVKFRSKVASNAKSKLEFDEGSKSEGRTIRDRSSLNIEEFIHSCKNFSNMIGGPVWLRNNIDRVGHENVVVDALSGQVDEPHVLALSMPHIDIWVEDTTICDCILPKIMFHYMLFRGTIIHRRYFYGSVSLLPLTTAFAVLPLPNIPFFWILFRTYSHWRALKGSERLLQLVSDYLKVQNSVVANGNYNEITHDDSEHGICSSPCPPWVLQPSEELEKLLHRVDGQDGLSKCAISDICKTYDLNTKDVLKYRNFM
ncbi:hypothetical protein HHK36_021956 [Tetracentron sinense]|uniref:Uncharacterized protein n=1 Tax=Tetracentron sinense TaxID=13715 RepID=A0A835DB49_TETSI|nr:hypothetical protein HHK36_021956 [Tetracentron sinense]